jgi:hypothetical protein
MLAKDKRSRPWGQLRAAGNGGHLKISSPITAASRQNGNSYHQSFGLPPAYPQPGNCFNRKKRKILDTKGKRPWRLSEKFRLHPPGTVRRDIFIERHPKK